MSYSTNVIEGYLRSLHSSFWGGLGWDPTDDGERLEAARWLERTIRAVQEYAEREAKVQIEGTPLQQQAMDRAMGLTFPPPAKGTHESDLYDRREIDEFGPPIGSLPGTGNDGYWARAADWSASS